MNEDSKKGPGSLTPSGLARPKFRGRTKRLIERAIERKGGFHSTLRPEQKAKLREWLEQRGVKTP